MSFSKLFGGVPFIHDTFNADRFLAAVAVSRMYILRNINSNDTFENYNHLLSPDLAKKIRESQNIVDRIESEEVPTNDLNKVQDAIMEIMINKPNFEKYFKIPFKFRLLKNENIISCSSYNTPQYIFLGKKAFYSKKELVEQILHEVAHNWLYFVEELFALQAGEMQDLYLLPSGTANKNIKEVLGAAHVASVLFIYYDEINYDDTYTNRLDFLRKYLDGCLLILKEKSNKLSFTGKFIFSEIDQIKKHFK